MKKRFTEQQIAFALRQHEVGTPVAEILRKMQVTEATFYRWKKLYVGMGVSEVQRLKQLEDENTKLKRLVAELTLDKTILPQYRVPEGFDADSFLRHLCQERLPQRYPQLSPEVTERLNNELAVITQRGLADQHVIGGAPTALAVDAEAGGRVALRIEIDDKGRTPASRQQRREIQRGRGFTNPALLIKNDYFCHRLLSAPVGASQNHQSGATEDDNSHSKTNVWQCLLQFSFRIRRIILIEIRYFFLSDQ